jgi:hypothetical protein
MKMSKCGEGTCKGPGNQVRGNMHVTTSLGVGTTTCKNQRTGKKPAFKCQDYIGCHRDRETKSSFWTKMKEKV